MGVVFGLSFYFTLFCDIFFIYKQSLQIKDKQNKVKVYALSILLRNLTCSSREDILSAFQYNSGFFPENLILALWTLFMFYRSDRSWCLNDEPHNKGKVVYNKIKTRSIAGNIQADAPEVLSRAMRDTTEVIDLKKVNEGKQSLRLPGEVMSADDQCVLQYGENYRQCSERKVTSVYITIITVF